MAGRIREDDIAEVRDKTRIDEIVSSYVTLRNAGGGSVRDIARLPRYQLIRKTSAEQKGTGNSEIGQVPYHFIGELHRQQGQQQYGQAYHQSKRSAEAGNHDRIEIDRILGASVQSRHAHLAELVDALGLGSSGFGCGGSSPPVGIGVKASTS